MIQGNAIRTDWCRKTPSCVSGKLKCICTSAGCVLRHMSFVASVSLPDALVFRVLGPADSPLGSRYAAAGGQHERGSRIDLCCRMTKRHSSPRGKLYES